MMTGLLGMALAVIGSLGLYLASPNQLALAAPLPRPVIWCASLTLALSLIVLLQWAGPATAVFILFTLTMLVWTIVPPVAAWRRGDRKAAR